MVISPDQKDEDDGFEDTDLIDDDDEFLSHKISIRNFNANMMSNIQGHNNQPKQEYGNVPF
jgi:hypothetical protein